MKQRPIGHLLSPSTLVFLGLSLLSFGCDEGNESSQGSAGMHSGGSSAGGAPGSSAGAGGASPNGGAPVTCMAAPEEDNFVDVPAADENIRYVGRVAKSATGVSFAFPAVQIQTVFEGDAVDMRLRDYGIGTDVATNYYWIIIDGQATKLQVCPAREVYPLARGLGSGTHTLTIVKRTESGPGGQSNAGKGEFLGLRVRPGTTLKKPVEPGRLIEFVGDSITCGYGNEVTTTTPDDFKFTSVNEDGYHAYGALTARALDADYVAVAASGRGVIRNYSGFAGAVVPEIYETTLHEDASAPAWDHSAYSPDVVVVNLGTNDFSIGIPLEELPAHRAAFKEGYIDFLARVREVHADASIVAAVGPMLGDSYPPGYNAWTSVQADVQAAVDARRAADDADVHYFAFTPQQSPYGEDWHPTIATHQKMADVLAPFIAELRGW